MMVREGNISVVLLDLCVHQYYTIDCQLYCTEFQRDRRKEMRKRER